jgi:hypothetical protein
VRSNREPAVERTRLSRSSQAQARTGISPPSRSNNNRTFVPIGAKGTYNQTAVTNPPGQRPASVAEDPARRRINGGGGRNRLLLQVFPMFRPEVLTDSNGPVFFHCDFNRVTAATPVRAGETARTGRCPRCFGSEDVGPVLSIARPFVGAGNAMSQAVVRPHSPSIHSHLYGTVRQFYQSDVLSRRRPIRRG